MGGYAQVLLLANAIIWLGLGGVTLMRMATRGQGIAVVVLAVLMAGNAGAMALAALGLRRGHSWAWWLAMAVMALNIVLTFTDQVGLVDLLTGLVDLIIVALLVLGGRARGSAAP